MNHRTNSSESIAAVGKNAYVEYLIIFWHTKVTPCFVPWRCVGLFLIFTAFCSACMWSQDEPVPKRRLKSPAPTSKTAPKAKSSGPTLLLMCDMACDWKLDGGLAKGRIEENSSAKVAVELGQHMVVAATIDGHDEVKVPVEVRQTGQTLISLELRAARHTRQGQAEAVRSLDSTPSLIWAKEDDGHDLTWQDAIEYCQRLRLDGHADWRLPTIDELQGMYNSAINNPGTLDGKSFVWHVKGNLKISGPEWSSTSSESAFGQARVFTFGLGARYTDAFGSSSGKRALCV
jgi:hypothetical protein